MAQFQKGDKVRIDIPDPNDLDHRYHRRSGLIIDVFKDELGGLTGNQLHNYIYTVQIDDSVVAVDLRHDDLDTF